MKRVPVLLTALLLLAAGCTDERAGRPPDRPVPIAALSAFDACGDYLRWIKAEALERVGPYGLGGGVTVFATAERGVPAAGGDAMAAAEDTAGRASTGTNNQEADVDEADLVKTDGTRIVTVRGSRLFVASISGGLRITGSVDVGVYGATLFLVGDRAYVVGQTDGGDMPIEDDVRDTSNLAFGPKTVIAEVDLRGEAPKVAATRTVEGSVTAGRLAGGVVRLVLSTPQPSGVGFVTPQGPAGEMTATAANRSAIERTQAKDWLPAVVGEDGSRTPLVECAAMYRPAEFSGFTTLTVLSIADGLGSLNATGVAADGGVTYASSTGLYVATTRFVEPEDGKPSTGGEANTDVHRFDIGTTGPAEYQASGRVRGTLINQYAMSEQRGNLRIATTTDPDGSNGETTSSSRVTVLGLEGPSLAVIGEVVGLGPTERIQGVRFDGDRGYVVTFRQTDPLYVLDLADDRRPKVLGELKVTGFSDYLHPVAPGRLFGVGVDADERGRQQGGKIALYDATDPTQPRELDRLLVPGGWFAAGDDPHAFTWDAERNTAVAVGSWNVFGAQVSGAVVVRVDGDRLVEVGRLVHDAAVVQGAKPPSGDGTEPGAPSVTIEPGSDGSTSSGSAGSAEPEAPPVTIEPVPVPEPMPVEPGPVDRMPVEVPPLQQSTPIERTFVVGGTLYALSAAGLSAHDPATLARTAWVAWGL